MGGGKAIAAQNSGPRNDRGLSGCGGQTIARACLSLRVDCDMITQQAVNGALSVLVEAAINHDTDSTLIGTRALRQATPDQLNNARHYCRIKFGYADNVIASAITSRPSLIQALGS